MYRQKKSGQFFLDRKKKVPQNLKNTVGGGPVPINSFRWVSPLFLYNLEPAAGGTFLQSFVMQNLESPPWVSPLFLYILQQGGGNSTKWVDATIRSVGMHRTANLMLSQMLIQMELSPTQLKLILFTKQMALEHLEHLQLLQKRLLSGRLTLSNKAWRK